MKKKTVGYLAIAGALSFGIIGGVGIPAFAATNTQAAEQSTKTAKKDLDDATKQKSKNDYGRYKETVGGARCKASRERKT